MTKKSNLGLKAKFIYLFTSLYCQYTCEDNFNYLSGFRSMQIVFKYASLYGILGIGEYNPLAPL